MARVATWLSVSQHGPHEDRMAWVVTDFFSIATVLGWPYAATEFDFATQFFQGGMSLDRDRELSVVTENYGFLSRKLAWCRDRGWPRQGRAREAQRAQGRRLEHTTGALRPSQRTRQVCCALFPHATEQARQGTVTTYKFFRNKPPMWFFHDKVDQ